MSTYTHISDETLAIALPLAHGSYQRSLLYGDEAWSGATLQGRAKSYGGRYAMSRGGLIRRLRLNGLSVDHVAGTLHNRIEIRITSRLTNR